MNKTYMLRPLLGRGMRINSSIISKATPAKLNSLHNLLCGYELDEVKQTPTIKELKKLRSQITKKLRG